MRTQPIRARATGTNLLLTLRAIMLKLDHARTKAFVPVSALWLLSFVVVRIVPLPMLVWLLYVADFTGVRNPNPTESQAGQTSPG